MKKSQLKELVREIIKRTFWMREQRLDESQKGEWWIYSDGSTQYANGDIGDSGHEGYVIEYVAREIYEHFLGDLSEEMGYLGEYNEDIKQALISDGNLDEEESNIWDDGKPTQILTKKLLEDKVYNNAQQASDAVIIAWGPSSIDAREYAMEYLGWKRLTTNRGGTNVQTWFLRQEDLDVIKRGIYDAWGDSDYGDEKSDDSKHKVTLEVIANHKVFSDIPMEELEKAAVGDIITHQRGLAWMRERKKSAPIIDPINFTRMG
jgi:hypothetical protein